MKNAFIRNRARSFASRLGGILLAGCFTIPFTAMSFAQNPADSAEPADQASNFTTPAQGPGAPPGANRSLPPPTVKQKARDWLRNTVGPDAIIGGTIGSTMAIVNPHRGYPPEWSRGPEGFARNLGNYFAQNTVGYGTRFAVGAVIHEDTRYWPSESTNVGKRIGHAFAAMLIDRSDSGRPRLAVANLAGVAASAQIPRAYMPEGFNDGVHAGQRTIINFGGLAINNLFDEFRPELKRLAQKMHLPFSDR